jgi:hypothetical protein
MTIILALALENVHLHILFVVASMEAEFIVAVVDFVHSADWRSKLPPEISFCNLSWKHGDVFMGLEQHSSVSQ